MSSDLARKIDSLPIHNMDDLARLADMFARSGYFTDAKDAAQIGVKILAGREMGFGPFASVNGVHVIQGKPAVGANLMAASVKAHPAYDYRVKAMEDDAVEIEFFQRGDSLGVSRFDVDDAAKAGTKNLGKFPRNMLFARAMSNGVRWYCPDVFMGSSVYTPEELGASVDDEGEVVDVPHAAHEATPGEPQAASLSAGETQALTLTEEQADKTIRYLADHNAGNPAAFATLMLDREVEVIADLTMDEARAVMREAKGAFDREQEDTK